MHTPESVVGWLAAIGALIGLGQLLQSKEPLTWRLIAGRALVSGGLGAASAAVLIHFPDTHPAALMGLAATLASLGTSFIEQFLRKYLKR